MSAREQSELVHLRTANVDHKSQIYDIMYAKAMSSAKMQDEKSAARRRIYHLTF